MASETPPQKPQTVGQYYIMEKVAQGGMAEIFRGLAYDVHGISQKVVCIKKILSHLASDREFIGSIIDEAKLAVKLVHGNIAQTFDLGKVGDDYYMVMEFVEGKTLSQIAKRYLARSTFIPVPCVAYFISEVAQGLDYMHRRTGEDGHPLHIVHRDISPQNIMVAYAGTVKIIDFGIAKAAFKAGSTDSGMLKGKFAYMSPEQAYGDAIDHRSDIFSLGVILHELLTGQRLFKAPDSRQTIRNVRRASVPLPSSIRQEIPDELDRIVMRALEKDRRHRYPYASELHDELVKFLHHTAPDFTMTDAAVFVQELFKDEMNRQRPTAADSKTPAFIIDRTNSALADDSQFESTGVARAPLDLGEFMLEEDREAREEPPPPEAPPPSPEAAATGTEVPAETLPPVEAEPSAPRKRPPWWKIAPILVRAIRNALIAALFFGTAAGVLFYLQHRADLPPAPAGVSQMAEAIVTTSPADASVSIDGKKVGQGSPVAIHTIAPEKEHVLSVAKDGYLPHEERITLARSEFRSIAVTLTPLAPPLAKLEISSTPPGAVVYLDDTETPYRTPATIERLDPKASPRLGLYLPGYKYWTKEMDLKAGQTRSIDVALAKNFGSILITSDPSDALVMIDGVPVGQTPLTREELEPDRVYRIEVWHEGYQPTSQEFKAKPGSRVELFIALAPAPPPEEARPKLAPKDVPSGATTAPPAEAPTPGASP
jgi:serine/threonine protein kinase